MFFRSLGLCLLLISTFSFAQGRKPAVEDFVGIEVEEALVTPQGTESLYNLEQDLNRIEAKNKPKIQAPSEVNPAETNYGPSAIFGFSMVLGLPLVIWFLMMGHLKRKASAESASNIEVLEKYRKERERKSEKSARKAS
jgi:hypothetical protein